MITAVVAILSLLLGHAVLAVILLGLACHHLADLKAYTRTLINAQAGTVELGDGLTYTRTG